MVSVMQKDRLSRIFTRLAGYKRDAAMHLYDLLRSVRWCFGGRRYYEKNFERIANEHKWVFILGCNNSGTSIAQRIMSQTGKISSMELEGQRYTRVFPRAMLKGKERVFMEYEEDLLMRSNDYSKYAPRLLFDWLSHIKKPLQEYVLEKTPANLMRMQWLDSALPNCYFIGIVRDGYAVCEGIRRKSHKSIERAAIQWNRANEVLEDNKSKVANYMELRYEDLVERPEETFERISGFLDVKPLQIADAMNIDYGLKTVSEENITGLKNLNEASIARLSEEDIQVINRYAENMLKHHGYFRASG